MGWTILPGVTDNLRPDQFRHIVKRVRALGHIDRERHYDWQDNEEGLKETRVNIFYMRDTPGGDVAYHLQIYSWIPENREGTVGCAFHVIPAPNADAGKADLALEEILREARRLLPPARTPAA